MAQQTRKWPEDEDFEPPTNEGRFDLSGWLRVFFFTWIAFAVGMVFPLLIDAEAVADGVEVPTGISGALETLFISLVLTSVGALFVLLPLLAIATWTARSLDNQIFRLLSFAAASAVGVLLTLLILRMAFWTTTASLTLLLPVVVAPLVRWWLERRSAHAPRS